VQHAAHQDRVVQRWAASHVPVSCHAESRHYRAPELAGSDSVRTSADMYAFGVLMWQLLAQGAPGGALSPLGTTPKSESTAHAQRAAAVGGAGHRAPKEGLGTFIDGVPVKLQLLALECMSVLVSSRPRARQVRDQLSAELQVRSAL
jgi:serine/threonine protein kinase